MSRRERPHSGSSSSRERIRDDHYRNSRDDSSDRDKDRDRDRERVKERDRDRDRDRDKDRDRDRDRERWRRRDRSRSSERQGRRSRSRDNRSRNDYRSENADQSDTYVREMSISPVHEDDDDDDEEENIDGVPTPPPPPRISKISLGFSKPAPKPIKMTLGAPPTNNQPQLKAKVASVFNEGSDEEPEEMPAQARMRMRNIGRETPTSAGPNSFGKTKHGFCDAKNIFQRNLREAMDRVAPPPNNSTSKYPNTIYRLQQ